MKKNVYVILTLLLGTLCSCNEFYSDEQYEHYVAFKAPTTTVSRIRLKYRKGEPSLYRLPLIVAGSTVNQQNLDVHIEVDNDTLPVYNYEHFFNRKDLYYKQLTKEHYSIPSFDVQIPAGSDQALLDINFNLQGLDLSDNWVLPLKIKDDPSFNYQSHPKKNYNNALLWITPFNDYSGTYQSTNLNIYPENSDKPLVVDAREAYVVDDKTIFFYAGAVKERRPDRKNFKIYAVFEPDPINNYVGKVSLKAENDEIKFNNKGQVTFDILETMDSSRPYLMRKTVTIRGLDYTFEDPWETEGYTTIYNVKGTMTMQRNINTLIDDEEFQIEW